MNDDFGVSQARGPAPRTMTLVERLRASSASAMYGKLLREAADHIDELEHEQQKAWDSTAELNAEAAEVARMQLQDMAARGRMKARIRSLEEALRWARDRMRDETHDSHGAMRLDDVLATPFTANDKGRIAG